MQQALEEQLVVTDDDHRAVKIAQARRQGVESLHVEMICRFV